MFTLTIFRILLSEGGSALWPNWQGTASERGKVSLKKQTNVGNISKSFEKWLNYIHKRFWMVLKFFWFFLTLSVLEKMKISIFKMPIISKTLNINKRRTTSAEAIKLHSIRKLFEYSLKHLVSKDNVYSSRFRYIAVSRYVGIVTPPARYMEQDA